MGCRLDAFCVQLIKFGHIAKNHIEVLGHLSKFIVVQIQSGQMSNMLHFFLTDFHLLLTRFILLAQNFT